MADPNRTESHLEHERLQHGGGIGRYVVVWIALLVGTTATFLLSKVHLGPFHLTVALLIAATKGALVALFFMHLWDQRGVNRLVLLTALVFVSLLIGLTVADSATRWPIANPPNPRNIGFEPPGAPRVRPEPKPGQLPGER